MEQVVNILTRTSKRPNYFNTCCQSINQQTYKNINHIICTDDKPSIDYIQQYTSNYIYLDSNIYKHNNFKKFWYQQDNTAGEHPAWWNSYFNEMYKLLKPGWVIFLDDDDQFVYENSIEFIMSHVKTNDTLIFWKVGFPGYTIPRQNSPSLVTNPPIPANISGIGFMFHTDYIKFAQWEPYSAGDFRVSYSLWNNISNKIEISEILTKLQDVPHFGNQQDK